MTLITARDPIVNSSKGTQSSIFTCRVPVARITRFFSALCRGKTIVAYTKPQLWKKEESKRLRGERDQIMFIDLRFERWQVVRFRKGRRQDVP